MKKKASKGWEKGEMSKFKKMDDKQDASMMKKVMKKDDGKKKGKK